MAKAKNTTKSQSKAQSTSSMKRLAAAIVLGLLTLHIIAVLIDMLMPDSGLAQLTPWFDMDRERNVPTAVSSLLLLAASGWAFSLVSKTRLHLQKIGWGLLGTLFGYFALDEFFIIHEQLAEPTRDLLHITSGSPFFHAWVIPAMIASICIGTAALIIKGLHRQLAVFSRILIYLFFFVLAVVTCEILGTYVYSNEAVYRLFMIPLEEGTELIMASFFWLHFRNLYLQRK